MCHSQNHIYAKDSIHVYIDILTNRATCISVKRGSDTLFLPMAVFPLVRPGSHLTGRLSGGCPCQVSPVVDRPSHLVNPRLSYLVGVGGGGGTQSFNWS